MTSACGGRDGRKTIERGAKLVVAKREGGKCERTVSIADR